MKLRFFIHTVTPIGFGGLIYLLLRKETILINQFLLNTWCKGSLIEVRSMLLPIKDILPHHVLYSLPDGLWVYAGTSMFLQIWKNDNSYLKWIWISSVLFLSILTELLQAFHLFVGTYNHYDIIYMLLFFIIPIIIHKLRGQHAKIQN